MSCEQSCSIDGVGKNTYTEELDVVQDLVVEGKVVGGNDINTSILLDLPVSETESLSLSNEIFLRDFIGPVSFSGLLQISQGSHTRETQDSGLNHCDLCGVCE